MKVCTKADCNLEGYPQPRINFSKDKQKGDGLASWCRACRSQSKREHYVKNRERIIKRACEWQANNLDRHRAYEANKRGAGEKLSGDTWQRLVDKYGEQCMNPECRTTLNVSMDHVIPLSLGGSNSFENLQLLCRSCNSSKNNRHATDYRKVLEVSAKCQ